MRCRAQRPKAPKGQVPPPLRQTRPAAAAARPLAATTPATVQGWGLHVVQAVQRQL